MVADGAAYAEHVAGGYVYTDEETVSGLARLFDSFAVSATGCQSRWQSSRRQASYGLAKVEL